MDSTTPVSARYHGAGSELLADLTSAVAHAATLEASLAIALRRICEAASWAIGEAWLPTSDGTSLRRSDGVYVDMASPHSAELVQFSEEGRGLTFALDRGVPGRVWAERAVVRVSDLAGDSTFSRHQAAAAAGLSGIVGIPVLAGKEVMAVLVFFQRDGTSADASDVAMIEAATAQLGTLLLKRRSEDTTRLAEARLGGIISIAADAIISVDASQRITLYNAGAEAIFGYPAEEILGEPLDLLLPEEVRERHREHIRAFAESSVGARRMGERAPIRGRRKSGESFPAEASISKFEVGGERVFTVILRDVTEQKRTEEGLRQAVAARDEVVSIVSHDLRNPLSVITMCASALAEDPLSGADTIVDLARTIGQSADWMSTIIQDLLDIARVESGRLELRTERQSLAPVLTRAVEMHHPLAEERGLRIGLDVDPATPLLSFDAARVLQVLANLIGNALKFTPGGGEITVRARSTNAEVLISVADTGRGIAVEDLPMLFDRFWQAHRSDRERGTGLGLAIAKGIVEAHGGAIRVESAPGEGSVFSFTLPVGPRSEA
jgi:PAS domain S-box-containing protein